jgi:hypothetical protein
MARPIKDTPILYGEDARRFAERIETRKVIPKERLERMKKAYEIYLKIKKF